jgi:hypothetical protein
LRASRIIPSSGAVDAQPGGVQLRRRVGRHPLRDPERPWLMVQIL